MGIASAEVTMGGKGMAIEATSEGIGIRGALVDNPGETGTPQADRTRETAVRPTRRR